MVKCCCGDTNCKIALWVEHEPHAIWFRDKNGNETLMYVDANTVVELIKELKRMLLSMTTE